MEIWVIRAAIQSSPVREPEVGRCSISGMISGVDVPYSISLYGPDYEKKIVIPELDKHILKSSGKLYAHLNQ